MMDEEDLKFEEARLGIEADSFLHSNLGRFMMERADLEIERETEALLNTDPRDVDACVDIRNKILVAASVKAWLEEVVREGRMAEDDLRRMEAQD